jgi:glycosyltransferase involved in cell wall biosynthesis
MALLEAMAAGCPIVATAVGGVPTAVVNGLNGITIPPRLPRRLAEAISQILTDPIRRRAYVWRGQQLFEQRFSASQMARAYEQLYVGA